MKPFFSPLNVDRRANTEQQLSRINASLLNLLREQWTKSLPNGAAFLPDGALVVGPGCQVETWFTPDQGLHWLLGIFGQCSGILSLAAETEGLPSLRFTIETSYGDSRRQLDCDLRGRLYLPIDIDDTTRLGLKFFGPLKLKRLSLELILQSEDGWIDKPAAAATEAKLINAQLDQPSGPLPTPLPNAAGKARPGATVTANIMLPRMKAVADTPETTARAASPASLEAARNDLAEIEFELSDFSSEIAKVPGAKATAGPPDHLLVDMIKHNYAWIGDQRGLGAALRAEVGQNVRMHLHGISYGSPNIEAFLCFRNEGNWSSIAAQPGYSASVRVPDTFEAVRIGLRLAGMGRLDNVRVRFEVEREVVATTRLELRRQAKQTGMRPPKLKVALIADPFTHENFAGLTEIITIRPNNWRSILRIEQPDFLFVESAWTGNDGAWSNKISKNIEELSTLINFCRETSIPTIFWNKEDPVHFHRFLPAAKLFDLVYTTCTESVENYHKAGISRVAVLPFSVNLMTYNPIGSGRPRERQAVFAGSYYGSKYPERTADMERILDLTAQHGLRIFDRHAGSTSAEFAFPERYRSHIVGSASIHQLDAEYKRARLALNVNTVKNSRSMFARRVVEVAITGTPIVSNASPALSEMFGNAMVASDDGDELRIEIDRLFTDNAYWQKRRRDVMRAVLMSHTMQDRLDAILRDLDVPVPDPRRTVCLVVLPSDTAAQPAWWQDMLMRFDVEPTAIQRPLIDIIPEHPATEYLCITSAASVLDENTLLELLRHQDYAQADIVAITTQEQAFRYGVDVNATTMLMRRTALLSSQLSAADLSAADLTTHLREAGLKVFGVERLGQEAAPRVALSSTSSQAGPAWLSGWRPDGSGITLTEEGDGFFVVSVSGDKPSYVRLGGSQPLVTAAGQLGLAVTFECQRGTSNLSAELQVFYYQGRERGATRVVPSNVQAFARAPDGWTTANLAIRLKGPGTVRFRVAIATDVNDADGFVRSRLSEQEGQDAPWLCVSSVYPHVENIYRNAFVHSRVRSYLAAGKDVRVVSMEGNSGVLMSYDFEGVQVFSGAGAALADVLQARPWKRALCHIVSTEMLRVLDEQAPDIRKIVWIHAIESERWYRRWFNLDLKKPNLEKRLLVEYSNSDTRTEAVREVYLRSGNTGSDCRTIFVSEWFRRNIAVVDVRPEPRDFRVIHNPIETSLFRPCPKTPADRFRWLSIRPFASRKYANDLTVGAILLLAKESWFPQVQISIVGRGPLFSEVVAPLRGIQNVTLEERFLLQSEIVAYHAKHGIFLCPTRHDSQGVSLGEAMSSGLVPISSDCMAIPEFLPRAWDVLAAGDDPVALADCIRRLVEDPDRFTRLSVEVAAHIAQKCGASSIITQEIEAITSD